MNSKGHFGLALLVMSLIMLPFGFLGNNVLIFLIIVLSAGLSALPDIDLQLEIQHRGFTHNIFFALIIGILFGIMFGYSSGIWYGIVGFLGGFMGIMIHLLGDMMTFMEFKPLWPFSQIEVAYGWFYADSQLANKGFFYLGIFAFAGYIMVSSGALANFI